MRDLVRFREAVEQYRKQVGRTEEELARELYISKGELNKRLHDYYHPQSRRTWRLKPEHVFKIVETLAKWGAITAQKQAIALFTLIEYPSLQQINWQASPWSRLHQDASMYVSPAPLVQPQQEDKHQSQAQDKKLYLQHVIQANEWLMLPGGREVPLERIYVSLRADEMDAKERQAERALYLQEVATLVQEARSRLFDPYIEFAALRKVIARQPKMFMLDARNWPRYFGKREPQSLSLAKVIERHPQVVFLGDPGSGKTTLGKWLILHFARALVHNDTQVSVPADLVRPRGEQGKETKALDLGPVKLPMLVSIAQYARIRKPKEQPDRGLTLYEYLRSGLFLDSLLLPSGLSQEAAAALVCEAVKQGQALIVLDGLDEVTDLTWRRKIMEAVRRFLKEWCPLEPVGENHFIRTEQTFTSARFGNQVIITSRPVGYQFDPLAHLPHYTVEEMDEQAIIAFCHAWTQHVPQPSVPSREISRWADQLHQAIFKETHPAVKAMAGNPLLLTLIAQLAWETRTSERVPALPLQRVALFERVERSFYDQRVSLWEQAEIKPEQLTQAFGAVAYGLHASETAGLATEEEVCQHLRSVLKEEMQVQAVLDSAREISGFLIARGEGVYGFLHRSVQEYFAAQQLASQFKQVEQIPSTLLAHALNSLWREPVVLAISLISRPRYPEKLLSVLFTALLDLPDPASEILPRRELLAAAACVECEHIPDGVGRRMARGLLPAYSRRSEVGQWDRLQRYIQKAFELCQRLPEKTKMEVEDVLCTAVQEEESAQRFAAVDLIIETRWKGPAIAEALVVAWRTYADPAGSLLVALEQLRDQQAFEHMLKQHADWFDARLLPLKRQMKEKPPLWKYVKEHPEWQDLLKILYLPPGVSFDPEQVNRDSPLTEEIMSVLQDLVSGKEVFKSFQEHLNLLAAQPGTALARDAALALSTLGQCEWITAWGEQVKNEERLARPVLATLTFFFILALTDIYDLALNVKFVLDRNYSGDFDQALKRLFTSDQTCALDIDRARINAYDQAETHANILHYAVTLALNSGFNFDAVIDSASEHIITPAGNRARTLDHARAGDLALALNHTFDQALDQVPLDDLERYLQSVKPLWGNYTDLVPHFDLALQWITTLKHDLPRISLLKDVWVMLIHTYEEIRKEDGSRDGPDVSKLTREDFPKLEKDLPSPHQEQQHLASIEELISLAQRDFLATSEPGFNALLEAGANTAPWERQYHGRLVNTAQHLLERIPYSLAQQVLRSLLHRLHQALETQDWPTVRMTLALVAACAETMPTMLWQAGEGRLEALLVRGTVDTQSEDARRFALTALSYLRTVTAAIAPALLAGCQGTKEVQEAAIEAAGRFQRIEGDLLQVLQPYLKGESVSTVYALAHLLGALGTSTSGMSAGLSEQIITALVEALNDPGRLRRIRIAGEDKGTLENVLYDILLRVAGWIE